MSFNIIGTGKCMPKAVVTNHDLSRFLDTNDEWIRTRTGIAERRILTDETLLDLAEGAARAALDDAGVSGGDIDMIICTTLMGDYISPSMSCLVSKRINAGCGRVFDINMACCGFLFALDMADAYFKSNQAGKVLIISAEAMSRVVDWEDRATCVLFGDGAGAVVLEAGDGLLAINMKIDGTAENINIPSPSGNYPLNRNKNRSYLNMNGQEIYKFAVSSIVDGIGDILEQQNMTPDDIAFYLLHQANIRIIESAKGRLGQSDDKFPCNIASYGNTSSATIPILLDDIHRGGTLKKDDKLLLSTFGAGLSSATCIIKWNKN